jgi:hypothetical protein
MFPRSDRSHMSKRLVFTTGVAAFAAGIAVGARWPHSTHLLAMLMEKLGVDLSEIVLSLWNPEARERAELERQLPAPHASAKRTKKSRTMAVQAPRRATVPVLIKVRRFSSRPALSAA